MAKGDDSVLRKRNKVSRKKLRKKEEGPSSVSARVASLIAAKKRRKSGKRRNCQGMCYSLPTQDDPFNERHGKKEPTIKEEAKRKRDIRADDTVGSKHRKGARVRKGDVVDGDDDCHGSMLTKIYESEKDGYCVRQEVASGNSSPSKFLILCLKTLADALWPEDAQSEDKVNPLFVNEWGIEFAKLFASRGDILENGGDCSSVEQIAWVVSLAADCFARMEKEGQSFAGPFLLYLVPGMEKATKVRKVCKPLKAHGIHTVSIHSGASIDHQIHGLKSCEPEFLVCTPERLLELISLNAIDISGTSLLVVDGIGAESGFLDQLKSIRHLISDNPRLVIFKESHNDHYVVSATLSPSSTVSSFLRLFFPEVVVPKWAAIYILSIVTCLHSFSTPSSFHLLVFWLLFENVMSLHQTKGTLNGLFEAGRVNEWVVTEKLGDALKLKSASKPRKLQFRIRRRLHLLELFTGAYLSCCTYYDFVHGRRRYFLYL